MESSSGGIYSLLAENVIESGGIVYAASYNSDFSVEHIKIDDISDIYKTRGSKYVQSSIGNTFKSIRKKLESESKVMFVGTPCQCEGLLSYIPYDMQKNLLVVDFICHGVPSRKVWKSYLKSIEYKNRQLKSINMRNKSTGWSKYNYSWHFTFNNKECYQKQGENLYMKGFISNIYLRPSCYECSFKGINRKSDITLGDFWGIWDIDPSMDDNMGTSLVILHSDKAMKIFNEIKDSIVYKEECIDDAVKINTSMIKSSVRFKKSKEFYRRLDNGEDFIELVKDLTKVKISDKIIYKTRSAVMKCKKILGGVVYNIDM